MLSRALLRSLFLPLLLLAGEALLAAQDRWDSVLDRYETICDRCIELRGKIEAGESVQDRAVTTLLQELNSLRKTLQDASGSMSDGQRARFRTILERYSASGGKTAAAAPQTQASAQRRRAAPPRPVTRESLPEPAPVIRVPGTLPPLTAPRTPRLQSAPAKASLKYSTPKPVEHPAPVPDMQRWSFDLLAHYGYGSASSYGLMAAATCGSHWGAWLAGRSNFTATGSSYDCTSDGRTGTGRFWGNGQSRYGIRRLAAGPLWRPLAWLGLYAGAGYAAEELDWQDAEGHWARVQDFSFGSVCWDAGVLLNWKHLAFSAGCSWCPFATVTAGVGVHF